MSFVSAPEKQVEALRAALGSPRRCAIVTHYNPDGDALGSALGLMHVLRAAGHRATVVLPNRAPSFLQWMPGAEQALSPDREKDTAIAAIRESEILFCLDFNRQDRVGVLEEVLRAHPFTVLVDHHRDPAEFAAIAFSDITACATSQMIVDIVNALGWADLVGVDAATCLYTGIMTDSGSFRFSSTTPHTMRVAAWLMEKGAPFTKAHEAIMDDNRAIRMKLLGFALSERMEVLPEWDTAIISLSLADLKRFDFQPGDTEGFVNYGLAIRGIQLAAFFMERPDLVKVSLRSKGTLPVDELVKLHFNGGGHRNAAGGQSAEGLTDAVNRFKALLPGFMEAHRA